MWATVLVDCWHLLGEFNSWTFLPLGFSQEWFCTICFSPPRMISNGRLQNVSRYAFRGTPQLREMWVLFFVYHYPLVCVCQYNRRNTLPHPGQRACLYQVFWLVRHCLQLLSHQSLTSLMWLTKIWFPAMLDHLQAHLFVDRVAFFCYRLQDPCHQIQ